MTDPTRSALQALSAKWREEAAQHEKHGDCYRKGKGWALVEGADALDALAATLPPSVPAEAGLRAALTVHCDHCGCDWLDNGINPLGCPYCRQSSLREALEALPRYRMDVWESYMAPDQTGDWLKGNNILDSTVKRPQTRPRHASEAGWVCLWLVLYLSLAPVVFAVAGGKLHYAGAVAHWVQVDVEPPRVRHAELVAIFHSAADDDREKLNSTQPPSRHFTEAAQRKDHLDLLLRHDHTQAVVLAAERFSTGEVVVPGADHAPLPFQQLNSGGRLAVVMNIDIDLKDQRWQFLAHGQAHDGVLRDIAKAPVVDLEQWATKRHGGSSRGGTAGSGVSGFQGNNDGANANQELDDRDDRHDDRRVSNRFLYVQIPLTFAAFVLGYLGVWLWGLYNNRYRWLGGLSIGAGWLLLIWVFWSLL